MNPWLTIAEHAVNILGLVGFYLWGHRRGHQEGYREGLHELSVIKLSARKVAENGNRTSGAQEESPQEGSQRKSESET